MEIHQLRYFVRVADTGSFTRAAADCLVAQPSLSQQIRRLERELGFALFDRLPVGLTAEGEAFLPHARAVLDRLADAEAVAADLRGVRRGTVTIGVSPFAGAVVLPALISAIGAAFPGITVATVEAGLSRLADDLRAGAIDLAMVLLPDDEPGQEVTTMLAEDLLAVLPADHPLAAADTVPIHALRDETLLLHPAEFGLRREIDALCAAAGFAPRVAHESGQVGILHGLAAAGLGITILPASAVRPDLPAVARPLTAAGKVAQRQIGLAMRTDRYVSVAARNIFALARTMPRT